MRLDGKYIKVIKALGRHKYLTTPQIAYIIGEKYAPNMSTTLNALTGKGGFIKHMPRQVGVEMVWYLTQKGAKRYVEHLQVDVEDVRYPKSTPSFSYEKFIHHKRANDCWIELYKHCNVAFLDQDVDKVGSRAKKNFRPKTRVIVGKDRLDPDGVFMADKKLYVLEYENRDSRNYKDLDQKLKKHIVALNQKKFSKKYMHAKAHRVLFICHDEGAIAYMQNFLSEIPRAEEFFLFKTYDDATAKIEKAGNKWEIEKPLPFQDNWLTLQGHRIPMNGQLHR